ncbi:MAG TPA: glycosyltransferase family 39 protein [Acidimicrobiales bacterium]|nr:glycosyltransferase family 39 protein [Acidimicrobiales bacterium]
MTTLDPIAQSDRGRGPIGRPDAGESGDLLGALGDLRAASRGGNRAATAALVGLAVAGVAGVVLRFWCPSALWLDETLSVNIAKLPLTRIPGALAHDGAPPLYYVALHLWMEVFGRSDAAVRSLSGLVSVGTIPLFWRAGHRLGGRPVAWAALVLGVASPFAIEYAATARMYSLMVLWGVVGLLAVTRALATPTRRNLVAVGAVTAAMLYTHYWATFVVAVTGGWLLWRIWREGRGVPIRADQPGTRPVFGAMVLGSLLWLPWAPVFVYQTLHTGTPWTSAAGPADLLGIFGDYAGPGPWGLLLAYCLFALAALGIFGRRAEATAATGGRRAVLLVTRPNPAIASVAAVLAGVLVLAVVAGAAAQAAFVARYAAVVLPLFLLVVATGVGLFEPRVRAGLLALLGVAGLLTGLGENGSARTQAVQVAAVLNAQAQPGDVVVYCPDQLGPAVDRLLQVRGVDELTFPRAIGPQRVDWVDYTSAIDATHVDVFASDVLSHVTSGHTLWLVERDGYPGFGTRCGELRSWLDLLRPTGVTTVRENPGRFYESENLVRYPS